MADEKPIIQPEENIEQSDPNTEEVVESEKIDSKKLETKDEEEAKKTSVALPEGVSTRSLTEEMQQSYLDYAMSVIVSRALPDARDGLKPVHRRVLYAMWETGLKSDSKYRKSAAVVGEVLKSYHPHGDMAVYDTMVGMAQWFKMNHTLVDGQGNFGSMDGDPAAAQRYTEARMSKIAEEMLTDIEKNTVDLTPNYDSTTTEPTVLPTKVPNLLLNGTVGIAVGMATSIPPHNLRELCDAIDTLIEEPQTTVEDLMKFVKGPDFPTGGTIHGVEGIKNAYATGHGKLVIRGEAEIVDEKKGFTIIIHSIPFQVNKADLITKIANLVKEKKIEGVTDIRDESDRVKSVRIVIDLKSTAYPKKILNRIYDLTPLQSSFHINMLALVDRIQPRILNLRSALIEFINHRQEVVTRRTQYDLDRAKERAHILEGLKKALDHIDEIISLIKKSANRDEALKNLISKFEFTQIQANAILDMRLSALAALERQKIENELAEKRRIIAELTAILADTKKILAIVKKELAEIREKYGVERRTKIIATEIGSFQAEDLIPNESVIVTMTRGNYIKRVGIEVYKKQGRGGKGVIGIAPKEEDQVIRMESASTHDTIYFFTNLGKVFSSKVYEIPPSSRQARGQAIVNLIQISPEEKVTGMLVVPAKATVADKFFLMATKKGVIKKTAINAYNNIRKTGLIAVNLKKDDELRFIKITSGKDFVAMVTKNGQGIVFNETEVRPMGRSASGVIGMRVKQNDQIISMNTFAEEGAKNFEIVTVLQNGYGKRTQITKHFPTQKRGGYGVRTSKVSEKTGYVVEALITDDPNQDLIMVSKAGQVIRITLKSAKLLGRDTQGVRLMKLTRNDAVASVSAITKEAEEEMELAALAPKQEETTTKIKTEPKDEVEINYYKKDA
jgi:DNA gyrase subunit A